MNALSVEWSETRSTGMPEAEVRYRKANVLSILSENLPALPNHLFRLNTMLAASPVDLKQVSSVIRSDVSLAAQLLRLCNSALFGLRRRVMSVEEAAVLMGTERLRNLVFACYLIQLSNTQLDEEEVESFWSHSLMTAMLSERLSHQLSLQEADQAYLGGLLHDVGKLPLLMVAARENSSGALWLKGDDENSLILEREYFGMDHCEVGRWLAINWNFNLAIVEVLESHHQPDQAHFAPSLVGTVAASDHFCELAEAGTMSAESANDDFYHFSLPGLGRSGRALLLDQLRREYSVIRRVLENDLRMLGLSGSRQSKSPRP